MSATYFAPGDRVRAQSGMRGVVTGVDLQGTEERIQVRWEDGTSSVSSERSAFKYEETEATTMACNSEGNCSTCGKPPGSPYRRRDGSGQITEGCVDTCHDGHISGEDAAWAARPEAQGSRNNNYENQGGSKMPGKLSKLARFVKMEEDADDEAIKAAVLQTMDEEAVSAMGGGAYNYDDAATRLEEMAKCYEDAGVEDKGEDEAPPVTMRKMASKFRGMGAGPTPDENNPLPFQGVAMQQNDDDKDAKTQSLEASLRASQARLAKLERAEAQREAAVRAEKERQFELLADQAIAGSYPKESRSALIKFARMDFEAAKASVAHLLPKGQQHAHIFDRFSSQGAPIGKNGRDDLGIPSKPKSVVAMGRKFIETDHGYASEIKRVAESTDPAIRAKVDQHLSEKQRPVLFNRLLAAEKVVKVERPDLAADAD